MGARPQPIAGRDFTAARMLDMSAAEFRRFVAAGVLPKPQCRLGKVERWRTADLVAIVNGDAAWPDDEDIEP